MKSDGYSTEVKFATVMCAIIKAFDATITTMQGILQNSGEQGVNIANSQLTILRSSLSIAISQHAIQPEKGIGLLQKAVLDSIGEFSKVVEVAQAAEQPVYSKSVYEKLQACFDSLIACVKAVFSSFISTNTAEKTHQFKDALSKSERSEDHTNDPDASDDLTL